MTSDDIKAAMRKAWDELMIPGHYSAYLDRLRKLQEQFDASGGPRCEVCRFAGEGQPKQNRECRRHAPIAENIQPNFDPPHYRSWKPRWPTMLATDWCGDFELAPHKVKT